MGNNVILVLNVKKVREIMATKRLRMKDICEKTGRHINTIRRYFEHPEKVRLDDICDLAEALGITNEFTYDELIIRINADEYDSITKSHGYGR